MMGGSTRAVLLISTILIVALVGIGATIRHRQVQAESAAQQNVLSRFTREVDNWTDDFGRRFGDLSDGISGKFRTWSEDFGGRFNGLTSGVGSRFNSWKDDLEMRLGQLRDGFEDTSKGVGGVVDGAWGLSAFIVTVFFDAIGNLHIIIPVAIVYFVTGFFGNTRMRVAILIGMAVAILLATRIGIVTGSILGIIVIFALVFGNRIFASLPRTVTESAGKAAQQ